MCPRTTDIDAYLRGQCAADVCFLITTATYVTSYYSYTCALILLTLMLTCMGNSRQALVLLLEKVGNVPEAIEFCQASSLRPHTLVA